MNWSCKIKFTPADVLELHLDSDKLWTIDRLKAVTHRRKKKSLRKYFMGVPGWLGRWASAFGSGRGPGALGSWPEPGADA